MRQCSEAWLIQMKRSHEPEVNSTMRNNSLLREITIVLVIKSILIFALWYLFFSQPSDRELDAVRVSQSLFESVPHPAIPAQEVSRHDH